jgi:hypothetical protein
MDRSARCGFGRYELTPMLYVPKENDPLGYWGARCERCGDQMREKVIRDDDKLLHIIFECENCDNETTEEADRRTASTKNPSRG